MTIVSLFTAAIASIPSVSASIEGAGHFRFADNGRIVYARTARFVVDEGRLEDSKGAAAIPLIKIPANASRFMIDADGTIRYFLGSERREAGRLLLALFPSSVKFTAHGAYLAANVRPTLEDPGNGKAGLIQTHSTSPVVDSNSSRPKATRATPTTTNRPAMTIGGAFVLSGPTILLSEIATVSGALELADQIAAIQFGPVPKSGIVYRLTRDRIFAKLKLAGIDEADLHIDCPDVVLIESAAQEIAPEAFIEEAKRIALARFGSNLELRVLNEITAYKAPVGKLELKGDQGRAQKDRFDVNVAIYVDGRRINSKLISLSGDSLAVAVKANSVVKVRVTLNKITVEATGKVKRDGRVGETVEVALRLGVDEKETTHYATVIGPGLVEIKI